MKITSEVGLYDLRTWSGATATKNTIIENGKVEEFEEYIEEAYPDGLTNTELNDILWFDSDAILSTLRIRNEEDEEEE